MARRTSARFALTVRNRPLNEWEQSARWEDHRDPECYFSAETTINGAVVRAEYGIMHNADAGLVWLYADDSDPATSGDARPMIGLGPLEADFRPTDLPRLAEFLRALADAVSAVGDAAREKLPALRREGREFAEMFERLVVTRETSVR